MLTCWRIKMHHTFHCAPSGDRCRHSPSWFATWLCLPQSTGQNGSAVVNNNKKHRQGQTYILVTRYKMPPVVAAESIIERLAGWVNKFRLLSVEVRVLRPANINLGVVVVADTIGRVGVTGVDLLRRQRVMDVAPGEVVIASMRAQQSPRRRPRVVAKLGVDDDNALPVAMAYRQQIHDRGSMCGQGRHTNCGRSRLGLPWRRPFGKTNCRPLAPPTNCTDGRRSRQGMPALGD